MSIKYIFDKEFIHNGQVQIGKLKCDINDFEKIEKEDIIRYRKNKYDYEILIKDRDKIKKKYKDFIVDKISIDELMILMIKGEK